MTSRVERPAGLWLGIATASFAALLLELALTRLYSVVLFYHFAFLAISSALLGLGAGGVVAHLWRERLATWDTRRLASLLCAINAVAIVGMLEVVLHARVSLQFARGNVMHLAALYFASAVPFVLTGALFSSVFARSGAAVTSLYAADLLGGALACIALVPLLNVVGAPNVVLGAAVAMAVASVAWSVAGRGRTASLLLTAILLALVVVNRDGRLIDVVYVKGAPVNTDAIEFSRWNAISHVAVERSGSEKSVVIDADASTLIVHDDPDRWRETPAFARFMAEPPAVANALRPRGDFAIIGPGGGVDVLRAVGNGSPRVTGIEINPLIATTIMREQYATYSAQLYHRPEVSIVVGDGRSVVRNSSDRYDVLQMTLVDTWASTAAGAFALSENNLYTVEAFREYFSRLKPDGFVAVTRWEFAQPREALRVVSVAMAALHADGVADVRRHFVVVAAHDLDAGGTPVVVLARKSAFTDHDLQLVRAHLATYPALRPIYLPDAPTNEVFRQLIESNDPAAFGRAYTFDVTPVTDDRPFFFFTLHPRQILNETLFGRSADWKVNLGVVVLGVVLALSILAVLLFLVLPLLLRRGGPPIEHGTLAYFVAVGAGFMVVEIAFIQRFVLFLGHPTYALTVVVFVLLLSCGLGSAISRRWTSGPRSLQRVLVAIALLVMVYAIGLPHLLAVAGALPIEARIALTALLLIPLGIVMGMPFPTGMRLLSAGAASDTGTATVQWAWAMNAGASVMGSVLAIVIAINFGMTVALLSGSAMYLGAALFARRLATARPDTPLLMPSPEP